MRINANIIHIYIYIYIYKLYRVYIHLYNNLKDDITNIQGILYKMGMHVPHVNENK